MGLKQIAKSKYTRILVVALLVWSFLLPLIGGRTVQIASAADSSTTVQFALDPCATGWDVSELRSDKQTVHPDEQFFVYVKISYQSEELQQQCRSAPVSMQLAYATAASNYTNKQYAAKVAMVPAANDPGSLHYKFPFVSKRLLGGESQTETLQFSATISSDTGGSRALTGTQAVKVNPTGPTQNSAVNNLPDVPGGDMDPAQTGQVQQLSTQQAGCLVGGIALYAICSYLGFAPEELLYGFVTKLIGTLTFLYTQILGLAFVLVMNVLNALLAVRAYSDTFVDVIYPGWVILRNLANIAFIVSLLVMGLRILFQQEDAGKTRGFIINLVIMALLVNFSLVIAQGVVAIADTVQAQFLPQDAKVIETIGAKLIWEPHRCLGYITAGECTAVDSKETSFTDIFRPLVLVFTSVVAFMAFVAVTAFVLIRLVALWILYMMSPIAYFGAVLPQTKKIASDWWDNFLKYTITVPVLAFFLNMAALVSDKFSIAKTRVPPVFDGASVGAISADFVNFTLTIITHFIVVVFLFIGMKFAMSSGTFGAAEVVKFAKQGIKAGMTTIPQLLGNGAAYGLGQAGRSLASLKPPESRVGRFSNKLLTGGLKGAAGVVTAFSNPEKYAQSVKESRIDPWLKKGKNRVEANVRNLPLVRTGKINEEWDYYKKGAKEYDRSADVNSSELLKALKRGDAEEIGKRLQVLIETGEMDDALDKISEHNGKNYSKDAAGIARATQDLVEEGLMNGFARRDFVHAMGEVAAKDAKKLAHYMSGTRYDKEARGGKGDFVVRQLDDNHRSEAAAAGFKTDRPDKFATITDEKGNDIELKDHINKQIKKTVTGGVVNALKEKGGTNVLKDNAGEEQLADYALGIIAETPYEGLIKTQNRDRFIRENGAAWRALRRAWKKNPAEVKRRMTEYWKEQNYDKKMKSHIDDDPTKPEKTPERIEREIKRQMLAGDVFFKLKTEQQIPPDIRNWDPDQDPADPATTPPPTDPPTNDGNGGNGDDPPNNGGNDPTRPNNGDNGTQGTGNRQVNRSPRAEEATRRNRERNREQRRAARDNTALSLDSIEAVAPEVVQQAGGVIKLQSAGAATGGVKNESVAAVSETIKEAIKSETKAIEDVVEERGAAKPVVVRAGAAVGTALPGVGVGVGGGSKIGATDPLSSTLNMNAGSLDQGNQTEVFSNVDTSAAGGGVNKSGVSVVATNAGGFEVQEAAANAKTATKTTTTTAPSAPAVNVSSEHEDSKKYAHPISTADEDPKKDQITRRTMAKIGEGGVIEESKGGESNLQIRERTNKDGDQKWRELLPNYTHLESKADYDTLSNYYNMAGYSPDAKHVTVVHPAVVGNDGRVIERGIIELK